MSNTMKVQTFSRHIEFTINFAHNLKPNCFASFKYALSNLLQLLGKAHSAQYDSKSMWHTSRNYVIDNFPHLQQNTYDCK